MESVWKGLPVEFQIQCHGHISRNRAFRQDDRQYL